MPPPWRHNYLIRIPTKNRCILFDAYITKAVSTHLSKNKQISLEKDKQVILKQNDEWHIAKVYDTVTVCMVIVVLGIAGFYLHHQRKRNDRRK